MCVMWMDPNAHLIPWAAHCLLVFSPIWAYILYCKVYVSPKMQRSIHPNLRLIALSGSLLVSTFPRRNICKLSLSYPPKWTIKTTRLHFPQSGSPLIKQHWNWTSVSLRNRHNRRGDWPFCHQEQSSDSFSNRHGLLWRKWSAVFTFFLRLPSLLVLYRSHTLTLQPAEQGKVWAINR